MKLTPLHTTIQKHGAAFIETGDWRFPRGYTNPEQELAAARERVALADVSPHGKLFIEGRSAPDAVRAAFGSAPETIGSGINLEAGHLYRLRPDQFYLVTPPGAETQAATHLEAAIAAHKLFVTVTNQTHGLAELRLIGPASRAVLSQLCALDFADEAFQNMTVKQTSVAKTKQMVIRRDFGDLPTYTLSGAASLAAYLWGVILEAGHEFDIAPIGVEALKKLE